MLRLSTGAKVMSMTEVATDPCCATAVERSVQTSGAAGSPQLVSIMRASMSAVSTRTSTGRAALLYGPTVLNPVFADVKTMNPAA